MLFEWLPKYKYECVLFVYREQLIDAKRKFNKSVQKELIKAGEAIKGEFDAFMEIKYIKLFSII